MQRRFAIIGHKAPNSGKLNLNDLAGGSGRMDVLVRAVNSALFVSHGIRNDTEIILHLLGGPGPDRRILFKGETLSGVRPDERSIAGQINAILKQPVPPIGVFKEITQGIFDTGGGLEETISEWTKDEVSINVLDANGGDLPTTTETHDMGFILSDHMPLNDSEIDLTKDYAKVSLGKDWLQGHACITIIQHQIDSLFS